MMPGHLQVCLFQPEIPQNTGNISRLVAASGSRLVLIKPFGFDVTDKQLRRPGLDYWPFLDLEIYDTLKEFTDCNPGKCAFFSKYGKKDYTEMPVEKEILVFGRETTGLPLETRQEFSEDLYTIPMYHPGVRSLNLANAVSIVLYHQLMRKRRQC